MNKYILILVLVVILSFGTSAVFLQKKATLTNSNEALNTGKQVKAGTTGTSLTQESSLMPLDVTMPASGAVVSTSTVLVAGKTSPRAEVSVNDVDTRADANGNFSAQFTLDEGENTIAVSVNDETGNHAERELTVTYEPGQ